MSPALESTPRIVQHWPVFRCRSLAGFGCPPRNVAHGYAPSSNGVSFQVHIYVTGRIEYHYSDIYVGSYYYNNARSATIGIQDHVADMESFHYSLFSHNTSRSWLYNRSLTFEPSCDYGGPS